MTRISYQELPKGLYETMMTVENYVRASGIPSRTLHLLKLRASQINSCAYCIDMHCKDAIKAGEDFQRIYALSAWRETSLYSEEERAILAMTEAVTQISVQGLPENVYAELNKFYNKQQIAQLILAVIQINAWNRLSISCGFEAGSYKAA